MRPIKFRAWDKHGNLMLPDPTLYDSKNFKGCALGINKMLDFATSAGLILMQFTGLHDKHGKEIWEGDVVKTSNNVWVVEWHVPRFLAVQRRGEFSPLQSLREMEVLGNIYEHPELLKKEDS